MVEKIKIKEINSSYSSLENNLSNSIRIKTWRQRITNKKVRAFERNHSPESYEFPKESP